MDIVRVVIQLMLPARSWQENSRLGNVSGPLQTDLRAQVVAIDLASRHSPGFCRGLSSFAVAGSGNMPMAAEDCKQGRIPCPQNTMLLQATIAASGTLSGSIMAHVLGAFPTWRKNV
jgi:hypothetical protein